jgi:hypothetical protein
LLFAEQQAGVRLVASQIESVISTRSTGGPASNLPVLMGLAVLLSVGTTPVALSCSHEPEGAPRGSIPTRPADAPGGAAIMKQVADLPLAEREGRLQAEILRGNFPPFLRRFKSVTIEAKDRDGAAHRLAVEVMPDYLAVGSDADFVRIPLTPAAAQRIATAFGCLLPTRRLVDELYAAAEVKLEPRPLTQEREAVPTFVQHNGIIEEQRAGRPLGLLVAGIKKDVVLTNRLRDPPGRVAIYGWHRLDGSPIQPLTTVHRQTYVDYSHGIRLVRRPAILDGNPQDVAALLQDPRLAPLLSDEGALERVGY